MWSGTRRRLGLAPVQGSDCTGAVDAKVPRQVWAEVPQDVRLLVSQYLGPAGVAQLASASRETHGVAFCKQLWRFFCQARWQRSANLGVYGSARDLYRDSNGWYPRRGSSSPSTPSFEVRSMELDESVTLTMDLRMTEDEIIAVSTASRRGSGRCARAFVVDPDTFAMRESIEVPDVTVNCCDRGLDLLLLGGDDCKIRTYRKSPGSEGRYQPAGEHACASQVNDLRLARENAIVAVRTLMDRQPAGLDIIPLERPDRPISFPGGGRHLCGRYVHALDGFEEGCSLSGVACSGEDPATGAYSAMLFDFRRSMPCVADIPVTRDFPASARLWPFRAGRQHKVYANLWHDEFWHGQGSVAMVDFRFATKDICAHFQFTAPVDDFRVCGDAVYAVCQEPAADSHRKQLSLQRCTPRQPTVAERLCALPEPSNESSDERLTVFSLCQRGFALSHGKHLSMGSLVDPWG